MRFFLFRLTFVTSVIAPGFLVGCRAESVPDCADVSWVGSLNHAQLTGAPSFSAVQIAQGEAITTVVPVDVNTRRVSVWIRSVDETPPGSASTEETDGGESVEVSVEDTNLPAGVYVAGRIDLEGDIAPQFAQYIAPDFGTPYILSVFPAAEVQRSCVTDILAPTFTVGGESANGLER